MPDIEPAAPNRASPVRGTETPSSPTKTTEGQGDDVIITGMGHSSPGHPIILAQHSAKEERAAREKGKWSTDLSSYAHLNVEEIHFGFLNRLHSNRDYEVGVVNLMKERYEVFSSPFTSWFQSWNASPSSPQGPFYDVNHKPGLCNTLSLSYWPSKC